MSSGREQLVRKYRKLAGIKSVELPVTHRYNDVYEHDKSDSHVNNGRPW